MKKFVLIIFTTMWITALLADGVKDDPKLTGDVIEDPFWVTGTTFGSHSFYGD
jgi:hypothetical protein